MSNDTYEIVLDYLEFIGECILQALANLSEEELTAAKRVASLALVDGLNVCLLCNHVTFEKKLLFLSFASCFRDYRNGCIKVMKTFKLFMVKQQKLIN